VIVTKREPSYEIWLKKEGIPVVEGYGVTDVRELELRSWRRTSGKGAFIDLKGMEGFTGMYVGEIPPSGWFHQHFNTGKEPARQLPFRYSGRSGKYLLGCWRAINKEGVRTSTR
jgi:hypothetical protein